MPEPALATIVVSYDSAAELPRTLDAVASQMRPGDELVVVDNDSSDGSAEVARASAPHARIVGLPSNEGFSGGCHAGARASSAELLFFLNPDAEVAPGCLDALRATAAERPDWGAWQALVLMPGGQLVNTSGGITHWLGLAWAGDCGRPVESAPPAPTEVSFASGAALVVRRTAWTALGGFDPAYFMYCEDVDLSLRLRLAGWGLGLVPAARVEHEYAFAKGDYKWFLLERNRWWTVLGTYPAPLLALLLPGLLAFDVALLAIAGRGGWLRAKVRAQRAVLRSLPWALRRRRAIQAAAQLSPAAFARSLTASLDSPFLGAVQSPVLRAAQRRYWTTVSRMLGAAGG